MTARVVAQINLSALQYNLRRVRTYAPHALVLAMLKADAYGHGLLPVAQALASADGFGVARLEEALLLRQHDVQALVVVMAGFLHAHELEQMAELSIATVVHTIEQVTLLETAQLKNPVMVWLKIDTGMHRLGLPIELAPSVYARLMACPNVKKPIVCMTHFAQADELKGAMTERQQTLFSQTIARVVPENSSEKMLVSIANSVVIIMGSTALGDWVRPGIMLYGVSPFVQQTAAEFDLQPVMTLSAKLVALHELDEGEAIGYGGTWICPEKMWLGVVAIGYGDGYPRHARNGTPVLVNGVRCALVGRVSMDLITVDLRNCPQVQIGDSVILWGQGLPIEEVAAHADTIAYELLCHVMPRVKFEYI
jgi:alanine racemase